MSSILDWGKGIINNIGWGQNYNENGYGKIYETSNFGETLFKNVESILRILADSILYTVDSILININNLIN